jgi:hypothetical protein
MAKFYTGLNRLDDAITRQQARIDALIETGVDLQGQPIEASLENNDKTMDLAISEHYAYQNQQSKAAAMGTLNTDEAQTIYNALGEYHHAENGGWQDGVGLATKVIVTQAMSELLERRIQKAR